MVKNHLFDITKISIMFALHNKPIVGDLYTVLNLSVNFMVTESFCFI